MQAIATARRLGAIVTATDVRPAAKEQVASLGAKFIAVEDEEFKAAETAGGYAKQMSAEYQRPSRLSLLLAILPSRILLITTALIPGRPAPELVTEAMVKSMRPGSVIRRHGRLSGRKLSSSLNQMRVVECRRRKNSGFFEPARPVACGRLRRFTQKTSWPSCR